MFASPASSPRPQPKGSKRRFFAVASLILLASVAWGTVRLRQDAARVARIRAITGSADSAADMIFAPSGHLLFSSDWKGNVFAWKMPQGTVFARLGARGRAINALAVSRDGAQLAAGDDGGFVQRWEVVSGRGLPLVNVGVPVRQLAFAPGGEEIAVVGHGADGVLRFDARTGEALPTFPARQEVTALAYTPDGKFLIAADEQEVRVWNRAGESLARTLKETRVSTLAVSPDSARVALSGLYRAASVYGVASGTPLCRLPVTQSGSVTFLPDSRRLLLGYGADLSLCDTETGKVAPSLTPPLLLGYTPTFLMRIFPYLRRYQRLPIQKVVLSPDGETIAFSVQDTIMLLPLSDTLTRTHSAEPLPARR